MKRLRLFSKDIIYSVEPSFFYGQKYNLNSTFIRFPELKSFYPSRGSLHKRNFSSFIAPLHTSNNYLYNLSPEHKNAHKSRALRKWGQFFYDVGNISKGPPAISNTYILHQLGTVHNRNAHLRLKVMWQLQADITLSP